MRYLLVLVVLLVGCGANTPYPTAPFEVVKPLATTGGNAVSVELRLERDAAGVLLLAATYTPEYSDFHLYSTDLAATGIEGTGRPTRLVVLDAPAGQVLGVAQADQPVELLTIEGFPHAFPIYPAGPVTLRQPISITSPTSLTLSLTYMACSSTACLTPVVDERLVVSVP